MWYLCLQKQYVPTYDITSSFIINYVNNNFDNFYVTVYEGVQEPMSKIPADIRLCIMQLSMGTSKNFVSKLRTNVIRIDKLINLTLIHHFLLLLTYYNKL